MPNTQEIISENSSKMASIYISQFPKNILTGIKITLKTCPQKKW